MCPYSVPLVAISFGCPYAFVALQNRYQTFALTHQGVDIPQVAIDLAEPKRVKNPKRFALEENIETFRLGTSQNKTV